MISNTRTIIKYAVAVADNTSALVNEVERYRLRGFQIHGEAFLHQNKLNQPMVEYASGIEFLAIVEADYEIEDCSAKAEAVLTDVDGVVLSINEIDPGESKVIKAPNGRVVFKDSLGNILDAIFVRSGGEIDYILLSTDGNALLKDTAGLLLSTTAIPPGTDVDVEAPDAEAVLKDTAANILSTTAIKSNESKVIVAPDAIIGVNGVPIGSVKSGGSWGQIIKNVLGVDVGTGANPSIVANAILNINTVDEDVLSAETNFNLLVKLNGNPAGVYDEPTKTVNIVSPKDLNVINEINSGDNNSSFTVKASAVGTINSVDNGTLTTVVITVNGAPISLPQAFVLSDIIAATFDVAGADTAITFTGTHV